MASTSTIRARRSIAAAIPNPGAARRRHDPPPPRGRRARPEVPAPPHAPARQGHGARSLHHGAAGADRLLRRQPRAGGHGLRGGGERGDPRPVRTPAPTSCRSTSPTCRRGPRRRAPSGSRPSTARSKASPAPPPCTSASATRPSSTSRPSGYSFLPELAECSCRQVSIETAQSSLDCAVLKSLPGKKIILGVIDLSEPRRSRPRKLVASRIRRALPFVDPGRSAGRAGLRHEVPAARRGLRQAAGDGRRRADRARANSKPRRAAGVKS